MGFRYVTVDGNFWGDPILIYIIQENEVDGEMFHSMTYDDKNNVIVLRFQRLY